MRRAPADLPFVPSRMLPMIDSLLDTVARAAYNTHWYETSPTWENASEDVKEWVRKQVLNVIREYERAIRAD